MSALSSGVLSTLADPESDPDPDPAAEPELEKSSVGTLNDEEP